MLPKFLLLVAATARGAGVSIVVRNLAGEDVVVSWLQPGREPRGRVPQQEKPLKNATTMSINSYETHEFIVASVAPARRRAGARWADADDNCAFGRPSASATRTGLHAQLLRGVLRVRGRRAAAAATERSAVFAVSDSRRRSPRPDRRAALEPPKRWTRWTPLRPSTRRSRPAAPAAPRPARTPTRRRARRCTRALARQAAPSLELERLFSAPYDRVPAPLPDPAHEKAEPRTWPACTPRTPRARGRRRPLRRARRRLGARALGAAAKAAAVAIAQGTAEAQKATRRRSLEKRNASCARGEQRTPAGRAAARGATDRDLDDPIALKARVRRLANFLSNYSLGLDGQEELMAVQYNPGQQYMLHCDGSCDGAPSSPAAASRRCSYCAR
ncbi:procollagen-proline 4-dioxygenase [Aureococcus anophagefferens]|nr:procollagen-proline 4-dioxygenase [Aureococcus anophagefferens]